MFINLWNNALSLIPLDNRGDDFLPPRNTRAANRRLESGAATDTVGSNETGSNTTAGGSSSIVGRV